MPELEKKDFVIELNNWKMKDFRDYITAVKEERWEDVYPLLARVLVEWPFGAVSSEAIENLGLKDLAVTIRAVVLAVNQAFSEGN